MAWMRSSALSRLPRWAFVLALLLVQLPAPLAARAQDTNCRPEVEPNNAEAEVEKVSGAFCISSNRSGVSRARDEFAGLGWIIDPEGEVLGVTVDSDPFVTCDLDLQRAADAILRLRRAT